MSILQYYVDKIISEEKIMGNGKKGAEFYRVTAIIRCGEKRSMIDELFIAKEWEEIKEKGYYFS